VVFHGCALINTAAAGVIEPLNLGAVDGVVVMGCRITSVNAGGIDGVPYDAILMGNQFVTAGLPIQASVSINLNGSLTIPAPGGTAALPGLVFPRVLAASLGAPPNGTVFYCSDCTIASPCAGGGAGAIAKRLNGVWVCN
jgi:hypothetical protein